ncbi:MAG TPA: ATP-binding protein [Burkholderiaceae bacterium]|nr:ATP-binding protein [Burkholderiaceae bacterium]
MSAEPPMSDERVLISAPTRRDGEVTRDLLRRASVTSVVCLGARELAEQLDTGVGAVLMTDHTLVDPHIAALLVALSQQPEWSDVPVLVMTAERDPSPPAARVLGAMTNVTVLDRPTSTRAMVSAVQASLRARRRQFQVRDQIIERLKAELALRDADRRKDEFLATLAHELRNPLAPIRTGLQVLDQVAADAPQGARVRAMMERQIKQLVKLIDDLLDVSRIATGKVRLQRERLDLRKVIEAALEGTQPFLDAAQLKVDVRTGNNPVWVVGDASRLAQVVSNLLHNAAKYTPQGGQVRVSLGRSDGHAVLRVVDDGSGIPPDMLEQVFELFAQVKRSPERTQEGLGIGLSLVRRLVLLHGGSVFAESAGLGTGSTFTVRLPSVDAPMATAVATADAGRTAAQRRMRVLVIDDNVDAADALAIQLQMHGHLTRTEYGGATGLRVAQEFDPEVVFCDIGMSGVDGHEVAARMRTDPRHASTVLVALTGWGSEEDKRRTRRTGFDFHLVKPVSVDAVNEILSRL